MAAFDREKWLMRMPVEVSEDQEMLFEAEGDASPNLTVTSNEESTSFGRGVVPDRYLSLKGERSSLTITCDHERDKLPSIPFICCSALGGFVLLPAQISGDPRKENIESVAEWMTRTRSGAFVAVFPQTGQAAGLALIQADHGSGRPDAFYKVHHQDSPGIWRDFYFQTVYTALRKGDSLWDADEIQIAPPNNGIWDLELMTVVLEAIGHLADQESLSVKSIHLYCPNGDLTREFKQAVATLNREQAQEGDFGYRDFEVIRERDHFETQHAGTDGALYWMRGIAPL